MNDIEILKEHCVETHNTHKICFTYNDEERIWSLIQRNKDLEQIEKEHKEENGRLRDKIKELEEIDLTTVYMDGIYDERNKWIINVKEKMNKDIKTNEHTILGGRRNGKTLEYGIRLGRIQMCEELLEESDK